MGLSSSQGRFLMLTARKSNIELEIQQTTQAKLALANEQDNEALLWSNGMNIQHLYYDIDGSGSMMESMQRLTYQLVTKSASEGGLDMRVCDDYGRLVVPELPDPMPDGMDIGDYVIEKNCTQADYFEERIKSGKWTMQQYNPFGTEPWEDVSVAGSSFIYQGVDSKEFAIAENDYNETVRSLENIDKRFDMRIQYLTNEQKAIETEIDSVKKVIDKNIEETFKTFG